MRIISGKRKGKRLFPPSNIIARPTTDFAKESLFNIINNNFDFNEISVLDIFTGTGNISYEFASRDAVQVIAVDITHASVKFINRTAELLDFTQLKAIQSDALTFINKSSSKWDIIFADPPYDFEEIYKIPQIVFENELLNEYGWLVIEHSAHVSFADNPNIIDHRKYGSVCFSF